MTKLLGVSGSLRKDSRNTALVQEAARLYGPRELTLADLNLPLYNGDDEDAAGAPEAALRLHAQIADADAVVIATPEYNKNLSGVLKNALDWVSRIKPNPWDGKPVAILSATAGRSGGERAQYSLRHCMAPFNPRILQGPEVLIAGAGDAFDENGHLTNEVSGRTLTRLMEALKAETLRG